MADAFSDPFKRNLYGEEPFSSSFSGDPFKDPFDNRSSGFKPTIDDELSELKALAKQQGVGDEEDWVDKSKDVALSSLDKAGRALNFDVANISGALLGMIKDDMTVAEGIKYGIKHNTGYQNVLEALLGKPKGVIGKTAMFGAGFVADIFLSPLTYASLGTSGVAKIAGKTAVPVTKAAFKAITRGEKEIITSHTEALIKEGHTPLEANKIAVKQANDDLDSFVRLSLKAEKKGSLTVKDFDKLIAKGLSTKTAEHMLQLSGQIIDRGGFKMFGKTLVSAKTLAKTPIGKAARRIGESGVVQAAKERFGNMFVYMWRRNPQMTEIQEKFDMESHRQANEFFGRVNKIFRGMTEADGHVLVEHAHNGMVQVRQLSDEIFNKAITTLKEKYPQYSKMKLTIEQVKHLYDIGIDEKAIADSTRLTKEFESLTADLMKAEEKRVLASGGYDLDTPRTQLDELIFKVDNLNKSFKGMIDTVERYAPKKDAKGKVIKPITPEEKALAAKAMLRIWHEKKYEELVNISNKIEKALKDAPGEYIGERKYNKPDTKESTPSKMEIEDGKPQAKSTIDKLALIRRELIQIQTDLSIKDELLKTALGARKAAGEKLRVPKVEVPGRPDLQKYADEVWNNSDSITKQMAKIANIDETDAYQTYFPHEFDDTKLINKYAHIRYNRVFGRTADDHIKEFYGESNNFITDPALAYKRAGKKLIASKLKGEALDSVFKAFSKQADGRTAKEMEELGFVKFEREILGEKKFGWIPKEIHNEMVNVFDSSLKHGDEIAKWTGFDWTTNLLKAWWTSTPSFHLMNKIGNMFNLYMKIGMAALNPSQMIESNILAAMSREDTSKMKASFRTVMGKRADEVMDREFVTAKGIRMTNKELIEEIKKHSDILDSGQFNEMDEALENIGNIGIKQKLNPLSLHNSIVTNSRSFGQFNEVSDKLMAIKHAVMEGRSVKEGVKVAEDALFNYKNLTEFEKQYMKRLVLFYTYARKNLEFQVKMLAENPGRTASQFKMFNNVNQAFGESLSEDEETGVPQYVLNSMRLRGNTPSGDKAFITGFGLPIEEFLGRFSGENGFLMNAINNTLRQVNPIIKAPIELSTGGYMGTGKRIIEVDNGAAFKSIIDALGGEDGMAGRQMADFVDFREIKNQPVYSNGVQVGVTTRYYVDPMAMFIMKNLPSARIMNSLASFEEGQYDGNPWAKFFTGLTTTEIDVAKNHYFKQLEQKKELMRLLDRNGIGNTKEMFYEYK